MDLEVDRRERSRKELGNDASSRQINARPGPSHLTERYRILMVTEIGVQDKSRRIPQSVMGAAVDSIAKFSILFSVLEGQPSTKWCSTSPDKGTHMQVFPMSTYRNDDQTLYFQGLIQPLSDQLTW
jgi:hypothetical protein